MKMTFYFLAILTILNSCMSTSNKNDKKKTNPPEEYFDGNDLIMAKAIYNSNIAEIERLIKVEKYDVNKRGNKENKFTYLGYCMILGETQSAEKLIELGADIEKISLYKRSHFTNIGKACANHYNKLIRLLVSHNVNLNPAIDDSPLSYYMIGDVDEAIVDLLISKGANLNHRDHIGGNTPIIKAFNVNEFEMVNKFLDKGADPMLLDFGGNSLAYLIQLEATETERYTEERRNEYKKLKQRMITEFKVVYPLKKERKKSMEQSIQLYENLTATDKEILGEIEKKRQEKNKELLAKGIDVFGNPFESGL
jgi:ankyrin repeat protein